MPPTYILARDHLEQAVSILKGTDVQTRQLRRIMERTIALMDEYERRDRQPPASVIDFERFRRRPRRD